jgi:hypothetical protein
MEKDKEIEFKPINEGLGFHPFSNGLPYAPVSKAPQYGTGAASAGRPVFIPPRPPVSSSVPRPVAPIQVPIVAQVKPTPQISVVATPDHGFGYLFRRCLAYVLDSIFNIGLCTTALSIGLLRQDINPDALFGTGMIILVGLFLIVFNWALITAQEVAFGTSLCKRLFGLNLQGAPSVILVRSVLFSIGTLLCGMGLVWALFDSKKRCWHDIAVDLQPTEMTRL